MKTHILLFAVLIFIFCSVLNAQMTPISVGKGSYASQPPPEKDAMKLLQIKPYLEADAKNKPLPTNDWWTSLLCDPPFPGKMWAYPLTVSADSSGLIIWYPKGWSQNGTELELGSPLNINGINRGPKTPGGDILICDFEFEKWPAGWKTEGQAFVPGPMKNTEHGMAKFVGNSFACSFRNGDAGTGTAVSPAFKIERDYIHLKVAGGDNKNQLGVFLEIDGKQIYQALGKKSNDYDLKTWDVKKYRGNKARIRLVDNSRGGWGFIAADHIVQSNSAKPSSGGVFQHVSTVRWGDWSVVMRLNAAKDKYADVTFGRGMPFAWIECKNIDLTIPIAADKITDINGKAITFPFTGDSLIIEREGRLFAIFADKQTKFVKQGNGLEISFSNDKKSFLSVGALPALSDARNFAKFAYAVPRDTRFDWKYDPEAGEVATTWSIKSEALQGTNTDVLQGWIPHHWRITKNDLKFLSAEFASQRGRLRLATGKTFKIAWPFNGMLPAFPIAKETKGTSNPFDKKRLSKYLEEWTNEKLKKPADQRYGADTYWGGKDFLVMAKAMTIATELKDPTEPKLQGILKDCLTDWFTYKPGEKAHFFAKYPSPWNGMVGFNTSYGSGAFTDNHFHYGYFTLASALLGKNDPEWLKGYGEMATLVAKQYANWDRNDKNFPFLRTFEPWCGHSYAGGGSNKNDGNNQESSSEAMESWCGVFLLGAALGNKEMQACGAMGYAIEAEATQEYWNDYYGWKKGAKFANHPPAFKNKHSIASVMRDRDIGHWTWFSGAPIHIYGIQWLPTWTSMHYMGRYPDHVVYQVNEMRKKEGKGVPVPFAKFGRDWGHVALGYLLWGEAAQACNVLDEEYAAKREIGDWRNAGITYYLAHTYLDLGQVAWDCHTSLPTSLVFKDPKDKYTVVAWNPQDKEVAVDVYQKNKKIKTIKVPARTLKPYPIK